MAEREKRRATTFRTSKGTIVNVAAPMVYVSPAFLSTEDVTNPTEMSTVMREALREELARFLQPQSFVSNRIYTSLGWGYFVHWIESLATYNKLVLPVSNSSLANPFTIQLSDDGINYRQVYACPTANENYALFVKDTGSLVLLGSGSGGNFPVGKVYRSNNGGKTWAVILNSGQNRVYSIEITSSYALIGTCNGSADSSTIGTIQRSDSYYASWSTVLNVPEGIRAIKTLTTRTVLAGSGVATGAGIYRSADDGLTWTLVKRFTVAESRAIYWLHEEEDAVYACSINGQVFKSSDDGLNWSLAFIVRTPFILITAVSGPLIRNTVRVGGYVLGTCDFIGVCLIDFKKGIVLPLQEYGDSRGGQYYCTCVHRGSLVVSNQLDNALISYSGKIQSAVFPLWSSVAIADTVNGAVTSHFSLLEHEKASAYIYSSQAGTLYIQGFDEVGVTFRDIDSMLVTANTLTPYNMATKGRLFRVRFVPSVAATVSAWVVAD